MPQFIKDCWESTTFYLKELWKSGIFYVIAIAALTVCFLSTCSIDLKIGVDEIKEKLEASSTASAIDKYEALQALSIYMNIVQTNWTISIEKREETIEERKD